MGVVPPFVGVDVKVTDVPEQMVVALATIVTEGTKAVLIVIFILFDTAFAAEIQVALLVISHVISSPLAKLELV
jgi:hypothetical protein